MFDEFWLLTLIVFLPVLGALALAFVPGGRDELVRYITLLVTIGVLFLTTVGFFFSDSTNFDVTRGEMQNTFTASWIPSFDIEYFMGVDGISFPLIMLTALVCVVAMGASWSIKKHIKAYCILFLLLETGMLGVFLSLDFFLFYVFWEVMLLPMYFLIGVWGGPRREYAALKFFLYTLVGSVLMLIAILLLYFNSDLREVAKVSDLNGNSDAAVKWHELNISPAAAARVGYVVKGLGFNAQIGWYRKSNVSINIHKIGPLEDGSKTSVIYDENEQSVIIFLHPSQNTAADVMDAVNNDPLVSKVVTASLPLGTDGTGEVLLDDQVPAQDLNDAPVHTFNLLALAAVGQHTECFNGEVLFGWKIQHWAFLLLFLGFIVKVPSVPFHTWLPDAHTQAPTAASVLLAGILLKTGAYGLIRFTVPLFPEAAAEIANFAMALGAIGILYGALLAFAQTDFKRLVAYSSVSHMGFVLVGVFAWTELTLQGSVMQMVAHGFSTAALFMMAGAIQHRIHTRDMAEMGGLWLEAPRMGAIAMFFIIASLGMPGLGNFVGEFLILLGAFAVNKTITIFATLGLVTGAVYALIAMGKVFQGASSQERGIRD